MPNSKTRRADQPGEDTVPQFILHLLSGFSGQRAVVNADAQVRCHGLQARGECLGVAPAVDEHQARGLRAQNVAKMAVGGVLFGTQGCIDGPDFVLRCG